jgi:hypothetical protein
MSVLGIVRFIAIWSLIASVMGPFIGAFLKRSGYRED